MDDTESVSAHTNPLDLFVAECNDIEVEVRISSIKKLTTVAVALDVEKTRTQLMPYLENLTVGIYNDDEILMNLAEQLGNFIPFVGGIEHVDLILNILEKLAAVEENIVQEKAIESLEKISQQLDAANLESKFVPLVFRLTESEWFTSKCSAASLFTVCYPKVSDDIKADMRKTYKVLCQDESPMVRRSAGMKLANFIKVIEVHFIKEEFISVCESFSKDDQDSVRLLAVDIALSIALRLKPEEVEEIILTTLSELAGDSSWRVRYQVSSQICAIQVALGHDLTRKYLILIYQNLINDTEPQVREASANSIVRFCELLQKTYQENKKEEEEKLDPVILTQMFPLIQTLDRDCNSDVKEALSSVVTTICPLLGVENTKILLLPLIITSLMNDSSKVKENIISNLNNIISVIGIADIADTVLQIIADLVNNSASVWRTRRNLIVTINYIAKYSGKEYFDKNLKSLYQKLLNDGVYAVRKTAPLILPILVKNFGFKWAKESILSSILLFSEHKHYLFRFVCLFCIDELVSPTLETKYESATDLIGLKYLQHVCNDENGNDKITTFLIRIRTLNNYLQKKLKEEWVTNSINKTQEYYVPEDDIKKYTEDTINMFIQGNNLNIRCVTNEQILLDNVYVEGLLDFIINISFTILKHLSLDPIDNVRLLVGTSLTKIQQFSSELDKEFNTDKIIQLMKVNNEERADNEQFEEKLNNETASDGGKSMEEEIIVILDEKLKA